VRKWVGGAHRNDRRALLYSLYPDRFGYLKVTFGRGARGSRTEKTYFVHLLVLEVFVSSRPPGMEARHLDSDPSNARLENLKWGTKAENEADKRLRGSVPTGRRAHQSVDVTLEQARDIAADPRSSRVIAQDHPFCYTVVQRIKNGKHWIWREETDA